MPLDISPLNDFAFKKTFGTPENRETLISLLNAILTPAAPIVEVAILNPFNLQDFQDDKLSILDVKAIDQSKAMYQVEIQLTVPATLPQRMVFCGCELYADQLREGVDYAALRPAYSIWLIDGTLWHDNRQVHHAFLPTDAASGRVLAGTLEIHTLELPKYNIEEQAAAAGEILDCWLYWLRHAQDYEAARLLAVFPQPAIQQATDTLRRIAEITENKIMYDARERAIRDRQWELNSARREGEREGLIKGEREGLIKGEQEGLIKGEIKLIRTLRGLLNLPLGDEQELRAMTLEQLQTLTGSLQEQLRGRAT